MPRHKKITDNFTIENFLFVLSEFSKLFLMRLNIHTHSVVMTTNTSKNHRCDINSQANVLYLSYNDSPGQLSALPLTYCSIINCGNVSKGWLLTSGYLHVRHVLSTIFSRDSVKKHVGKVPGYNENTCMRNEWMKSLKRVSHNDGSALFTCHVWLE